MKTVKEFNYIIFLPGTSVDVPGVSGEDLPNRLSV
jgi:hypothetical protein